MAEGTPLLAAVVIAAQALETRAAGGLKAAEHPVPYSHAAHPGASLRDDPDELVPDREARIDLHPAVVDVQVRAADRAGLHLDDRSPISCNSGSATSCTSTLPGA